MKFIKNLTTLLKLKKILLAASMIVVFCVTYQLIMPAITMERKTYCGMEEHEHTDECYTTSEHLVCGQEESDGHTHSDKCYSEEKVLVCDLEENEDHKHTDACYETERVLTCGKQETPGHKHTDDCYEEEKELTCGKDEHVHSEDCFVNPETNPAPTDEKDNTADDTKESEENTEDSENKSSLETAGIADVNNETEETDETTDTAEETAESEEAFFNGTLTAEGDDYTIKVTCTPDAGVPVDAALEVEEILQETSDYEGYISDTEKALDVNEGNVVYARFFDITIVDSEGNEVQPQAAVDVKIELADLNKDTPENEDPQIVHFGEDEPTAVEADVDGDEVSFEAEGFSVYGVVYTVDFAYSVNGKVYQFSFPGGGFVSLTDLVEVLGIAGDTNADKNDMKIDAAEVQDANGILSVTASDAAKKFVADVDSVEFSSPALVDVSKVTTAATIGQIKENRSLECEYSAELTETQIAKINAQKVGAGDWTIISLQPFDSEETLTVTMSDGEKFTIRVTDAQLKKSVITASGNTYEITVTYGSDAKIPDGAELKVEEILPEDKEYQNNCRTAENALRAESAKGLSAHTMDFDISIVFEGKTIEPAPDSEVSVEIRLVEDLFTETEAEAEEKKAEIGEAQSAFAFYNGAIYDNESGNNVQTFDVVHLGENDAEVMALSETPEIQDGNVVLKFETESFSDYIVTGSTEKGENYTIEGLPSVIYVGDTINLYSQQNNISYQLNNHATETSWEDRYNISGHNYAKGVVIRATSTGWIKVGWKDIEIRPKPAGSHPATVTTVPNASIGVTMNMFDYDLKDTLDDYFNQFNLMRQPYDQTFKNAGVNKDKKLKFWGSGINTDWYGNDDRARADVVWDKNKYTEYKPGLKIVQSQLSGGYPKLNGDGNQSLDYLFTDSNYNNDVKAYMGVDGLFQKDDKGYYYYDSGKNYAWLNPNTKIFEVYGGTYHQWSKGEVESQFKPGQYDGNRPVQVGDNGRAIGFFPFHEWDPDHDKFVNWDKGLNHHFGLSMSLTFSFPNANAGQAIVDENGNEIVFEFNGDDDMWVFIDGKLCMDIGGIHQPIDGQIDFTNRSVTVAGEGQNNFNNSDWNKLFDGKQHTLKVFYLERGGCDSNCKIKFNLTHYTDVELDKVDKENTWKGLAGAQFQLFKEEEVIEGGETVKKLVPAYWYAADTANPNNKKGVKTPFIETSDAQGHVRFKNVPLGNYVLKEIAAPPEYKLNTDVRAVPITLTKENDTTVVKYSISGEDADGNRTGMQIANEKPEPMDISFEKKWDDNGNTTPPEGAAASFELKRIQKKQPKKVKVVLQYANENAIASEENLGDGDKIQIDGYKIKTSAPGNSDYDGEKRDVTGNAGITIGENKGTLDLSTTTVYISKGHNDQWGPWTYYTHDSWTETSSSSTPVTYSVNTEHANANNEIILKLNKNSGDFVTPPSMSATRGTSASTNGEETVTVAAFTLPADADQGETWKKTFEDLPKTDLEGNPYKYFIVETGTTGADKYTTTSYTSADGTEESPLQEDGNIEITNRTPEPEPDPIDLEADKLPEAKSKKVLTPNNDGTYTLTLSVDIPQYKNRSRNRANVVVVYDSSNSMNRALGYREVSRWADPVFGRINNEGENWDQVYKGPTQQGWDYYIYDRNLRDWVEYKSEWGFWVPDENAGTRMTTTKKIVKDLGKGLLENNKPGEEAGEETVQLAFVEYATELLQTQNPTADYDTYEGWVEACEAPGKDVADPVGATNWEAALKAANGINFGDDDPTYIIFLSDGNPTKRTSSIAGDPDDTDGSYVSGTHGDGTTDEPYGLNLEAANREAQKIQDADKILYAFGIFGEADKMQNLVPRDEYYDVNDPNNLKGLFDDLITMITARVGYTDVVIQDGITSLTSSTLVSGTAQNFMYKVTDKTGKDVTDEMLAKLGNPKASYVETETVSEGGITYKQKEVTWNLGHEDILLEGGTYSVSFIVWPSQEAYDLAADLNNGLRKFSELNDVEASQVEYVGGVYKVKTNTHESAKGKTAKQINDGPVTPTPNEYKNIPMEKHVDPMPLTDTTVKIQKKWKAVIDKTQLADIKDHVVNLELDKNNVKYIDGITISAPQPISVPDGNEWIWPEYVKDPTTGKPTSEEAVHHISAGLMVSTEAAEKSKLNVEGYPTATFKDGSGKTVTYHILESGRDYEFKEVGESDYRFELKEEKFHPMVVDGKLCDVSFSVDKKTVVSMAEASGNTMNMTAENQLKGGIRIYKEVYEKDEKTRITTDQTKFGIKVRMMNPPEGDAQQGTPYAVSADNGGYRILYGSMRKENERDYGDGQLSAREVQNNKDQNRSRRYAISGGEFTAEIYPDECIQVANVDRGVIYEVSETAVEGYENFAIVYTIDGKANTADPKTMTSDQSHQVVVKNKKTKLAAVDITVRKVTKDNVNNMSSDTLPGATFVLEKYTASDYRIKDKDWSESAIEDSHNTTSGVFSFTGLAEGYYQLVETICPEGYIRTAMNPRFHVKAEGNGLKVYIITSDGQEVLQTDMLKVDNYTINVGNEPGAALPHTGGPGTFAFRLLGLALLSLGIFAAFSLRRRKI